MKFIRKIFNEIIEKPKKSSMKIISIPDVQ